MKFRDLDLFEKILTILTIIIILLFIGIVIINGKRTIDKGTNFRTEIGTVTDKGTKRNHNEDRYLVYTVDEQNKVQVYEITDSIVARRFNSSDIYAGIEVGKTYEFTVAGKRNNLFSWYPNIFEYEEVTILGDDVHIF